MSDKQQKYGRAYKLVSHEEEKGKGNFGEVKFAN